MGSLSLDDELKNAICEAETYFSVTLKKENLSPVAENQRQELGQRFATLITKYKVINRKDEQVPPPRPPKHVEDQELYDDVKDTTDQKVAELEEYDDIAKQEENYEVMSDEQMEYSEAAEGPPEALQSSEKNVDPGTENYAEPEMQEPEEYEIVSAGDTKDALPAGEQSSPIKEQPETYEICETNSQKDGSLNANLANLFEKVKVNEIQHIAYKGYLNKLRKPGKMFLGSKWQKRYCVVTDYFMYYFKTEKALSQKGTIVLPEYNIKVTSRKNEHEFELTQEGYRPYKFSCENKEEFDKFVEAVKKATSKRLSGKQSQAVEKILSQGDSSNDEDTSSMTYDDVQAGKEDSKEPAAAEPMEESEEMYELVGEEAKESKNLPTTQSPNQIISVATTEDEEQEMYDDVASGGQQITSSAPAQEKEEEIEEDLYELVGTEAKNPPVTSQQTAPRIEEPPPRTQPQIQPPPRSPETHLSSAPPTLPLPRTPEMQRASNAPALPPPRGSEKSTPGPALPPPRGVSSSAAPALPPSRTSEVSSGAPERPPPRSSTVAAVEENGPPTQDGPPSPISQAPIEELKEEEEELYDDVTTCPPSLPECGHVGHDDEIRPPPEEDPVPTEENTPVRPPRRVKPDLPIRTTPVTPRPNAPSVKTPVKTPDKTPDKPPVQPKPKSVGRSANPPVAPKPEPTKEIDYSKVYMALWNCKADADDELEFTRGDLVYIYEKLQNGWWVGSLVQPQGYSLGLVPKDYLKEAFDLSSWKREACA